jgi:hypothetical protein
LVQGARLFRSCPAPAGCKPASGPDEWNAPAFSVSPAKRIVSAERRMRGDLRRAAMPGDIATQSEDCGGRWGQWLIIFCINL